jgi:hypothetical protein
MQMSRRTLTQLYIFPSCFDAFSCDVRRAVHILFPYYHAFAVNPKSCRQAIFFFFFLTNAFVSVDLVVVVVGFFILFFLFFFPPSFNVRSHLHRLETRTMITSLLLEDS